MLMFVDEPEQWQFVDANVWWKNQLRPLLADDSDGGHLITRAELDSVRGTNPTNMSEVMMEKFVTRLNNSLTNWENGILEGQGVISYNKALERMNRITNDTRTAKDAGAQTIFDWHNEANQQFLDAKTGRGVCAKVRIQIVQELVLTRDAFEATLEIENGETNTLEKIRVEIIITRSETGERATELFSIGQPKLSGLTDVSGNGTLTPKQEGSSIWLIVPYSEAAPQEDTQYDMGGKLFYTLNGEEITVPLFPDTVTVKPDPRLHINYFLEKYVLGDDPFTTDVVEPSVPFSLGVLVSNTGYGSANQMQITSAQPEIIDNEKGLLISFKIIGAQLGAEPISTSLTVNFGDILPNTTKMARWMMTSSLPGRFSNYSATFENINPLGDPQLSVLDSVEFHELLHVVRVEPDDGIPDFLVVPDMSLDLLPNFIYTSHDGNNPYPVSSANITHIQFNGGKEIKLTVKSDSSGWIYARTEFSEDLSLDVDSVTRSDGKTILPDYNMWIGKINDNSLLQIVDFYENTTGVHMYMYTVKLARKNIFAPKFDPTYISLNVTEGTPTDTLIYTAMATDNDTPPENMVSYHLQSTGSVPFSVNDQSGEIRVSGDLDREMEDIISFRILATDGGEPQKTGTLSVDAHVIDVNDEYPVFNPTQYSTNLEVDAPVSYSIVQVSATDRDSGSNGQLTYGINNPDGTFEIDPDTGELRVASSLNTSLSPYVLEIFAEDRGIPPKRSPVLAQVTIKVTPVNRNAPVFDADVNSFSIAEAAIIGTVVGSVSASDHDTSQTVTYMLGPNQNIPFEVNTTSGALRTTGVLDYEKAKLYEFTVLAKDNGNPPTGSLTGTTTVSVNVTDVNDNAAAFADNAYDVTILEDSEMGTNVIRTVAFDADSGENGRISIVTLIGSDLPFEVNFDGSNVTVRTAGLLDRETKDSYVFNLVAVDAGVPQKTGLAQVTVTVEDVNDNPPVITPPADPVTLAPDTPVNTEVTTVQATDADITGMLRYSLSNDGSGKFAINAETGAIRLIKPLAAAQTSFTVDVLVTDGVHNVTASVNLQVATSNTFAPFFNKTKYETMVLENSAPGVVVETVVATDQDSSVVTYSIADGNVGSAFTIDAFSGQITVQGSLDRESRPMYNLTVVASDSGINGQNILTSAVPVFITVGDVNEFTPEFQETELVSRIYENLPGNTFLREFKVQDNDTDQTIHFTLIQSAENAFFISSDGQIYITKSLDREMTGLYRMAVVAKDDGVPPRSSTMDLEVQVLDVNDNAPVFTAPSYNETVNLADLPDGSDAILTVKAVDADIDANGVVRYGLESSPNDYFEIDSIMGVIRILPAGRNVVGERTETLTVVATDRGTPPQTSAAVARITLIGAETPRTNYSIEVSEDTLPGSTILHLNVTQVGLSVIYTIVDGNAEGKFSVEVHGHLVLESRLDRETTPSYVLTLNGTDGQFTVHITVTRSTSSTSTTTSTTTPTTTTTTETLTTTTTETSTTTTTETSTTTSSETESTTTVLTPSTTTPTIQQLNEELTAKRREVFDVMEQLKDAALPTQDFMRMFNQWRIMIFEYLQVYNERQERMKDE
ncbi:protocadherin Fat 4-like isoform X3 [Lingula anatina]|uniref:Protocadherin Fat 4-like isoform X3 n=1 Tax=Lingula anatina TaxID=7574 RepID=A0A2R2MQD6_LINAN|nr:protocadherin Fat 4-like isoform X3 [Lingula anatina]|eukprot:XP_023932455.1 protocadherin Fat 4-like isoform X3 [Lingula anatina]